LGLTFELQTPEGNDIGTFETSVPEWRVGDKFLSSGNRSYQITAIVPLNEATAPGRREVAGRWQVEPL